MTSTVAIVALRPAHLEAVLPYEEEMFGTEAWSRSAYEYELADRARRFYVAAEDASGALLGWAGVRVVAGEAEILTVGVVPPARRRGVARKLLAALLAAAVERRATAAYLEVRVDNVAARSLYESEGFVQVGIRRGYYDAGRVDAVVMRTDIGRTDVGRTDIGVGR